MTTVKLRAVLCLSALIIIHTCATREAIAQRAGAGDERLLDEALVVGIAMGIPGLSVAIGVGDSVIWAGTAGYSDILRRVPVKVDDRFGVGSITKTFVARVILQLVEEGKIDLDKKPQDYLDLDIIRASPNTGTATLRHLLNHQSGIPTWEFQEDWIRKGRGAEMELGYVWGKTETLEYCTGDLLSATNEPGQRYSYSNTNYTILGLIIEAVTWSHSDWRIRSSSHSRTSRAATCTITTTLRPAFSGWLESIVASPRSVPASSNQRLVTSHPSGPPVGSSPRQATSCGGHRSCVTGIC